MSTICAGRMVTHVRLHRDGSFLSRHGVDFACSSCEYSCKLVSVAMFASGFPSVDGVAPSIFCTGEACACHSFDVTRQGVDGNWRRAKWGIAPDAHTSWYLPLGSQPLRHSLPGFLRPGLLPPFGSQVFGSRVVGSWASESQVVGSLMLGHLGLREVKGFNRSTLKYIIRCVNVNNFALGRGL